MAFIREWFYPIVAAGSMFGGLWQIRKMLEVSPLVELLFLIPSGAIVYAVICLLLARYSPWQIEGDIRSIAGSFG
jgi:PST family polysaccharide transporter/lipopolysaccharide exporter